MIIFDNWIGQVPENERILGCVRDNLSIEKEFLIREDDVSNWSVQLFWKSSEQKNGLCVLEPQYKKDGTHFFWQPTKEILQDTGILQIQLRGICGDKQKHTNILDFIVLNTLPDIDSSKIPLTETEKLTKFFQELKNQIQVNQQNNHKIVSAAAASADKAEKAAAACRSAADKANNASVLADAAADKAANATYRAIAAAEAANKSAKANAKRYGYRIDKLDANPSTRITYLYDAVGKRPAHMDFESGKFDYGDWEKVWFVSDNRPVMLRYDGTEDYELNPNDYSKKISGEASDVSNVNYEGNAMSAMPTVWLKQWEDSRYEYVVVAPVQYDSTYRAYAHQRLNGSIAETRYLPMYEGSLDQFGRLRSLANQKILGSKTAAAEITAAAACGKGWYTLTYNVINLMQCLLTLISKTEDSQTAFGRGCCGKDAAINTGSAGGGQFWGAKNETSAVKVFCCENWWGNAWKRIAGLVTKNGHLLVKTTSPYNITGEDYSDTGIVYSGDLYGFPKLTKMTPYGRYPLAPINGGSSSTYTCDVCMYNKDAYALYGGYRAGHDGCGMYQTGLITAATDGWEASGTSLTYLGGDN